MLFGGTKMLKKTKNLVIIFIPVILCYVFKMILKNNWNDWRKAENFNTYNQLVVIFAILLGIFCFITCIQFLRKDSNGFLLLIIIPISLFIVLLITALSYEEPSFFRALFLANRIDTNLLFSIVIGVYVAEFFFILYRKKRKNNSINKYFTKKTKHIFMIFPILLYTLLIITRRILLGYFNPIFTNILYEKISIIIAILIGIFCFLITYTTLINIKSKKLGLLIAPPALLIGTVIVQMFLDKRVIYYIILGKKELAIIPIVLSTVYFANFIMWIVNNHNNSQNNKVKID